MGSSGSGVTPLTTTTTGGACDSMVAPTTTASIAMQRYHHPTSMDMEQMRHEDIAEPSHGNFNPSTPGTYQGFILRLTM
jgi:hypothetical protein